MKLLFSDYRIGIKYEFEPLQEQKLKLFWHIEASFKQRQVDIAANHNLGIYESRKHLLSVICNGLWA